MFRKKIMILSILAITGITFSQNVIVTDSAGDPLIVVNDEGSTGSITLPSGGVPGTPDDKLYNYNGDLFWNTKQLEIVYAVGDFAQGGVVFYVDETGEHGLACVTVDQSSGMRWYAGTNGNTQAKGDGPFSGERNTSIIIAAQVSIGDDGNTYAARICAELYISQNGKFYGDWYLPSKEELNLMYQNKAIINATATENGGTAFTGSNYQSSTEYSSDIAWCQFFTNGTQSNTYPKGNFAVAVRAIRAF